MFCVCDGRMVSVLYGGQNGECVVCEKEERCVVCDSIMVSILHLW